MTDPALPPGADLTVLMISLSDYILTGASGGDVRERHLEYAKRLKHLHMVVYSPRAHDLTVTQLSENLTVYPTRSRAKATFVFDATRIGAALCREQPIDLITTQDPFSTGLVGWWLKRRFNLPLDVQSHASFFDNPYWIGERPLRYRLFNIMGKAIARRADTFRVVNTDERDRAIRAGVEADRIEVINTPVNLTRFLEPVDPDRVSALRRELGIPDDAPVILWVGRMVWFKRLPTLLKAFALVHRAHPDTYLVLVGDDNTAEGRNAHRLVSEFELTGRVIFTGRLDHADLPAYYALCDMFALSSVYEGLPKVLIEAAASGKPVVAAEMAGSIDAVINGETGLLAFLENPEAFAARLAELLNDPEKAREMGAQARQYAEIHYDRTATIERIIAMFARCAAMREA